MYAIGESPFLDAIRLQQLLQTALRFFIAMCPIVNKEQTEYEYVRAVSDTLRCARCAGVLENPVQASCGDRYHHDCFKSLIK